MHRFIAFKLENEFLDIPDNLSISLEITSGIFSLDIVEGNYSLPINLPPTPKNTRIFGYANRIDTSINSNKTFETELWLNGRFAFKGYIKLLPFDGTEFTAYFICGAGSIKEILGTEKLRDIFQEDQIQLTENSATLLGIIIEFENPLRWPTISFSIQDALGNGYAFSGDSRRSGFYEITKSINDHIELNITASIVTINGNMAISLVYDNGKNYTIISQGSVKGMTLRPLETYGEITYPSNVDWNNKIAFPSLKFVDLYEGKNPTFQSLGIANHYIEGKLQSKNNPFATQDFLESTSRQYILKKAPEVFTSWEYTLTPQIYNRYVLEEIYKRAKIKINGAFVNDQELNALLLFNPRTLDKLQYTQGEKWQNKNIHDLTVKLKNHLPDISIKDFLLAQKLTFGLAFSYNFQQTECKISFLKDILSSNDYDDWSAYEMPNGTNGMQEIWKGIKFSFDLDSEDKYLRDNVHPTDALGEVHPDSLNVNTDLAALVPGEEEIRYIKRSNWFYRYQNYKTENPSWKLIGFNLFPYKLEGENIEINSPACPLPNAYAHTGRTMPITDYPAFSLPLEMTSDGFKVRFSFYRGIQNDVTGAPYAMASSNRFDNNLVINPNWKYDLQWNLSDKSLFNSFWDVYANWHKTARPVTRKFQIPLHKLLMTDLSKKKRIGNMNYLIDNCRLRIGPNGLEPIEVNLYSVNFGKYN